MKTHGFNVSNNVSWRIDFSTLIMYATNFFAKQEWIISYVVFKSYTKKQKTQWDDEYIPYSGIPFMVVFSELLDCYHDTYKDFLAERKKKVWAMINIKWKEKGMSND